MLINKTRVLIVEDDPMVSEMIRGMIEDLGYVVVGDAVDGQEAVKLTQKLHPEVILMDIEMPLMDGIEATKLIYETQPTPIVILTAYDTPQLLKRASQAGVGAYLVKPPNMREVERAITIAMARFNDLMSLRRLNEELKETLLKVKQLSGLLPICAHCKKIRNDQGYWQQVELYICEHTNAEFSHGICPDCMEALYSEFRPPKDNS